MSEEASLDEFAQDKEKPSEYASPEEIEVGDLQQLDESPIESWELVKLGKIISLEYGDSLPSDSRENGSVPVFGSNGQVDTHSEAAVNKSGIVLGRKGSIGEIEFSDRPFWPIDTTYYITDEETRQNLRFLYYLLQNIQLERLNAASAIPGLNRNDTYGLNVITPPLEEQRKIATVLYTVDQSIQKIEEIIEQTKRIDDGLLQGLFSGEHLDCDYDEVQTIGSIPDYWESGLMAEECTITMGSSPKSKYYNESGDGLPFFQANNEFGLRSPSHDRWCSNPVKTAEEGSTLMTIRGTYVGQVNIADRNCCIGRGLAAISAGDSILPEYLYHHLRRRERYVKSIAIGSTFDSVSSDDLDNLAISIPPKKEQKEIAESLEKVHTTLIDSHEYISQLKRLKQGLMQDLLSGVVRTHKTDIDIPEAVLAHG